MTEAVSSYNGFLPHGSDGNAAVKLEFVVEKKAEEKVLPDVKVMNDVGMLFIPRSEKSELLLLDDSSDEQTNKKTRGQNKNRPRPKREVLTEKLCPSKVNDSGVCAFGDKCKYIHNVAEFMKIKPPDLGKECVAFKQRGKCQYSFACRFGGEHITFSESEGYKNVVREELKAKNPTPVINVLPRELQLSLRKRKFDFSKTESALKDLQTIQAKRKKAYEERNNSTKVDKHTSENVSEIIKACSKNVESPSDSSSQPVSSANGHGCVTDADFTPLRVEEKKKLNVSNKLYLAPLTTCGNLPFRVVCKRLGADITCGEMALSTNLLQGQTSEWALIKRHPCEDMFGVQLCGGFPDTMSRCAEMLNKTCQIDFIDINLGCPIDLIYKKGSGSALMRRTNKLFDIVNCMNRVIDIPLTCKLRAGIENNKNCAHTILPTLRDRGVALATVHGRSREARYTKAADWSYIDVCARAADPMPLFGNGDILSYRDYYSAIENTSISGIMIARGALIKPWIFTEIKERRDWDISSTERFGLLKDFVNEGLMHWGSDNRGIEITRRFLLEWCSFLHRYIPVGLLERIPQRINERPPYYRGRDDMETLMASPNSNDWVKLSEMLLGKVPDSFNFLPKHKANSYK